MLFLPVYLLLLTTQYDSATAQECEVAFEHQPLTQLPCNPYGSGNEMRVECVSTAPDGTRMNMVLFRRTFISQTIERLISSSSRIRLSFRSFINGSDPLTVRATAGIRISSVVEQEDAGQYWCQVALRSVVQPVLSRILTLHGDGAYDGLPGCGRDVVASIRETRCVFPANPTTLPTFSPLGTTTPQTIATTMTTMGPPQTIATTMTTMGPPQTISMTTMGPPTDAMTTTDIQTDTKMTTDVTISTRINDEQPGSDPIVPYWVLALLCVVIVVLFATVVTVLLCKCGLKYGQHKTSSAAPGLSAVGPAASSGVYEDMSGVGSTTRDYEDMDGVATTLELSYDYVQTGLSTAGSTDIEVHHNLAYELSIKMDRNKAYGKMNN